MDIGSSLNSSACSGYYSLQSIGNPIYATVQGNGGICQANYSSSCSTEPQTGFQSDYPDLFVFTLLFTSNGIQVCVARLDILGSWDQDLMAYVVQYGGCSPGTYLSGSSCLGCNASCACPAADSSNSCQQTCSAGFYCPIGSASVSQNPCPAGYYCPAGTSNYTQHPCPAGTYNQLLNQTSASSCISCSSNYSCVAGTSTPAVCPANYFCPTSASTPILCPAGFFCPSGTLVNNSNPCSVGTYSYAGQSNCTNCPVGAYCPQQSLSNFLACPAGSYGSLVMSTVCFNCSDGTFSLNAGSSNSSFCVTCPSCMQICFSYPYFSNE